MDDTDAIVTASYQGGPSEIDQAGNDFIKEFAAKFNAEEVGEQPAARAPVPEPGAAATAGELREGAAPAPELKATAQENTVTPPPKEDDRGLERLVAREVALREREAQLSAQESRYRALDERLKGMEATQLPQNLMEQFEYSPEKALEAMGFDPDQIVRQVIANRMGDNAPPEVRQSVEAAKVKKEITELRNQLHEHQRTIATQQFIAQVQAGARDFITRGISEDVPTIAAVAKANPERVYREIMEEISRDAQIRMRENPNGDVLPYNEAAKRVEARWSEFRTLITPTGTVTPAPQTSTTGATTALKPNPQQSSVTTKPPTRPIAPWLQRGDLEDEGIKAALATFKQAENR